MAARHFKTLPRLLLSHSPPPHPPLPSHVSLSTHVPINHSNGCVSSLDRMHIRTLIPVSEIPVRAGQTHPLSLQSPIQLPSSPFPCLHHSTKQTKTGRQASRQGERWNAETTGGYHRGHSSTRTCMLFLSSRSLRFHHRWSRYPAQNLLLGTPCYLLGSDINLPARESQHALLR